MVCKIFLIHTSMYIDTYRYIFMYMYVCLFGEKNRYARTGNPKTMPGQWLQMNLGSSTYVCGVVIQAVGDFDATFVDYPSGLSLSFAHAFCLYPVHPLILSFLFISVSFSSFPFTLSLFAGTCLKRVSLSIPFCLHQYSAHRAH